MLHLKIYSKLKNGVFYFQGTMNPGIIRAAKDLLQPRTPLLLYAFEGALEMAPS